MATPVKTVAYVFGAVYALVGLIGFALTGFSGFASTEGPVLIIFEINPLHNLVHLAIGLGLIGAAAASTTAARSASWAVAIVYTVVGILGFFITDTALNILALNTADHFLHLATAAVLFVVLAQSPRTATA